MNINFNVIILAQMELVLQVNLLFVKILIIIHATKLANNVLKGEMIQIINVLLASIIIFQKEIIVIKNANIIIIMIRVININAHQNVPVIIAN